MRIAARMLPASGERPATHNGSVHAQREHASGIVPALDGRARRTLVAPSPGYAHRLPKSPSCRGHAPHLVAQAA